MKYFDSHVHSTFSHDGRSSMEEQCARAAELGFSGVSFTDHYDVGENLCTDHIERSVQRAAELREQYKGRLQVFQGVEIGDGAYQKEAWDRAVSRIPFDVVLGSIHTILTGSSIVQGYTGWRCLKSFDDSQIQLFLTRYYQNMIRIVQEMDFDVLTHLTLPLRYLNGGLHKGVTLQRQMEQIEQLLREVVRRELALEINTSGIKTDWGEMMPDRKILTLYYQLGGRKITLGSDAHNTRTLGAGLQQGAQAAKEIGFTYYCYYQNRKAVEVELY